jgi:hypothetical protein
MSDTGMSRQLAGKQVSFTMSIAVMVKGQVYNGNKVYRHSSVILVS